MVDGVELSESMRAAFERQAQEQQRSLIEDHVRIALGMTLRGLIVSFGNVPPPVLLEIIARTVGNMCASALVTDLQNAVRARATLKDAFTKAVNEAPLKQPPGLQQVPHTGEVTHE